MSCYGKMLLLFLVVAPLSLMSQEMPSGSSTDYELPTYIDVQPEPIMVREPPSFRQPEPAMAISGFSDSQDGSNRPTPEAAVRTRASSEIFSIETIEEGSGSNSSINKIVRTGRMWSTTEIWMGTSVLCFIFVVMLLLVLLIRKAPEAWKPDDIIRIFGLLTVIGFSVILVAVGYGSEQIAPVMGLLGIVIGYLLKKEQY